MITCEGRPSLRPHDPIRIEVELNLTPFAQSWSALGDSLYAWGVGRHGEPFSATAEQYDWVVKACERLSVGCKRLSVGCAQSEGAV